MLDRITIDPAIWRVDLRFAGTNATVIRSEHGRADGHVARLQAGGSRRLGHRRREYGGARRHPV